MSNQGFFVGQLVTYDNQPCVIDHFPVKDMAVVVNATYVPGDWFTAKVYLHELTPNPIKVATTEGSCNCPSRTLFNFGCQCGGS